MTIELDTITCADYRDLLAALPDGSVDAVITDPPYGTTQLEFDKAVIDWQAFWSECKRVLKGKKSPVILFSAQPFTTDLINSNRGWFRYDIVWEKTIAVGFLDANKRPLRSHEIICVFGEQVPIYIPQKEIGEAYTKKNRPRRTKIYGGDKMSTKIENNGTRFPKSIWKFAQDSTGGDTSVLTETGTRPNSWHPTQKPIALMERLILTYTEPNAIILDPFCGGGSTGVAARNTGRHYIMGDNDALQLEKTRKRLSLPYTEPMFK